MACPGPKDVTEAQGPAAIGRPRRESEGLRLSAILVALRSESQPQSSEAGAPAETAGSPPSPPGRRVRSNVTLGEIVDRSAHAGFGFLAAFLALVAIPFVGLSTPFGLAIGFLGVQMIAGRNRPWLPKRLRRHVVTMSTLDWLSVRVVRWTSGLERWVKPRWTFLTSDPLWRIIGVGLVLQGIGLSLPIPVPASNWVFIVPIVIYGIGLLEDDGLLILVGHVASGIMVVSGVIFWEILHKGVSRFFA